MIRVIHADGSIEAVSSPFKLSEGDTLMVDGKISDYEFTLGQDELIIMVNGEPFIIENTNLIEQNSFDFQDIEHLVEGQTPTHTSIVFEDEPDVDNVIDTLGSLLDLGNTAAGEEELPSQAWNPEFLEANEQETNVEAELNERPESPENPRTPFIEEDDYNGIGGGDAATANAVLQDVELDRIADETGYNDAKKKDSVTENGGIPDPTDEDVSGDNVDEGSTTNTTEEETEFENTNAGNTDTTETTPISENSDTPIDSSDEEETIINDIDVLDSENTDTDIIQEEELDNTTPTVEEESQVDNTTPTDDTESVDVGDDTTETNTENDTTQEENSDTTDDTTPTDDGNINLDNIEDNTPTDDEPETTVTLTPIDDELVDVEDTSNDDEIINNDDTTDGETTDETEQVQEEEETSNPTDENDETDISDEDIEETPADENTDDTPAEDVVDDTPADNLNPVIPNAVYSDTNIQWTIEDYDFDLVEIDESELPTRTEIREVEIEDTREVWVGETYRTETEEFTDTREVEETFTNTRTETQTEEFTDTRMVEEEFTNTREVQVIDVEGHYETEEFTNTREVEEEFQDTRMVEETFTNSRTETQTEEFEDTREVWVDTTYTTETFTNYRTEEQEVQVEKEREVVDTDAMLEAGYTDVDGTWYSSTESTELVGITMDGNLNQGGESVSFNIQDTNDFIVTIKSFKEGKDSGEVRLYDGDTLVDTIKIEDLTDEKLNNQVIALDVHSDTPFNRVEVHNTMPDTSQEFKVEDGQVEVTSIKRTEVQPIMTTETYYETEIQEVQVAFEDTREVVDVEGHYETETFTNTREVEVEVEFEDTRMVEETFTNTRTVTEEFTDTREVWVDTTYTTITEEFTDTRMVEEEFTNTRDVEVEVEFEDTRMVEETFTNTREVEVVDVAGHYETETYTTTVNQEVEVIDEIAALEAGYIQQAGEWYQIELETTPITETRDALVNQQGVISYVESDTGIDAFTITATINTTEATAGQYARLVDLRNEDGSTEFSLAFDKDGTKIRGWNAETGEQVTYDMSDKLGDGEDHTIEWQVTETTSSLMVDGEAVGSINYSTEITINDDLETVITPEGTYSFTGTMVESETTTFDDVDEFAQSLVYDEPYEFTLDFDSMSASAQEENTMIIDTHIDMDAILMNDETPDTLLNDLLGETETDDTSLDTPISDNTSDDSTSPFDAFTYDSSSVVNEMMTMIEQHIDTDL